MLYKFFCWVFNVVSDEARNIADLAIMLARDNEAEKGRVKDSRLHKLNDSLVAQQKTGEVTVRALSSAGSFHSSIQIVGEKVTPAMNDAARYLRRKGYITAVFTESEAPDMNQALVREKGGGRF